MKNFDSDAMNELEIFAENVAFLRQRYGLSKCGMASVLEIGVATLNKLENGIFPKRLEVSIVFRIYDNFNLLPSKQFTHTPNGSTNYN